jgi:hypothetical protein
MDLNGDSWRTDLWRRAPQAGAAAPSDEIAHGSRKTRDRQRAAALLVKRKLCEDAKEEGRASITIAPDPLYVDTSQHARRLSGPTFAEAVVKRGVLL